MTEKLKFVLGRVKNIVLTSIFSSSHVFERTVSYTRPSSLCDKEPKLNADQKYGFHFPKPGSTSFTF